MYYLLITVLVSSTPVNSVETGPFLNEAECRIAAALTKQHVEQVQQALGIRYYADCIFKL
jgi:hypothetical protein